MIESDVELIEDARDGTSGRLCEYSGCRAALPAASGPGNRAKYCQDGRTWGPKRLTCKQAALALENAASLRDGSSALEDPAVTALGGKVDAVLDPARELLAALTGVRAQLDEAVTTAQQERDAAAAREAEACGEAEAATQRADAAERRAVEADEAAAAAARRRSEAETVRDAATAAQRAAERAQAVAEGRLADAQGVAERVEARAEAVAGRAEELDKELVRVRGELESVRQALRDERERAAADADRAKAAAAEGATRLDRLRDDYEERLDRLHAERQAAVEDAVQRARAEAEQARNADADRHASAVGELHERIGRLERHAEEATNRADAAAGGLAQWQAALRSAVAEPGEDDLRTRLAELLQAQP